MLNGDGLLNPGVHDLTVEQIKEAFGSFSSTDRRCRLFERLKEYIAKVTAKPWFREMFIDGSFVTDKESPSDIDLIVVVDNDLLPEDLLRPADYNLLSRRRTRRMYGFDVISVPHGSEALTNWLDYFSLVRGSSLRKGIVRLSHEAQT